VHKMHCATRASGKSDRGGDVYFKRGKGNRNLRDMGTGVGAMRRKNFSAKKEGSRPVLRGRGRYQRQLKCWGDEKGKRERGLYSYRSPRGGAGRLTLLDVPLATTELAVAPIIVHKGMEKKERWFRDLRFNRKRRWCRTS